MTILGSPSSERAIATDWRWPPDIAPTSPRTDWIVVTDSSASSSLAFCSIATSSSTQAPGRGVSRPRNRFSTTSRLSHSARSW